MNHFSNMKPIGYRFPDKVLKNSACTPIGTAVRREQIHDDPTYVNILQRDFSSITSEYNMKMGTMWIGGRDSYHFVEADALVGFARKNGMRIHGWTWRWDTGYEPKAHWKS